MPALRPAAAVLIGAVSSAVVFALAFAMIVSRPPAASSSAASSDARSVIVEVAVTGVTALATITDPSGQNSLMLNPDADAYGDPGAAKKNLTVTVPPGATLSVSVQPVNQSSDWSVDATSSCGIYADDSGSRGQQLVVRQSVGVIGTTTPPTVCTWLNR